MIEEDLFIDHCPCPFVLLPHGLFRITNPQHVVPGRVHTFRYYPFNQFASIVAISL